MYIIIFKHIKCLTINIVIVIKINTHVIIAIIRLLITGIIIRL